MVFANILFIVQRSLSHIVVHVSRVDGSNSSCGGTQYRSRVQPGVPLCNVHVTRASYLKRKARYKEILTIYGAKSSETITVGVLAIHQYQRVIDSRHERRAVLRAVSIIYR